MLSTDSMAEKQPCLRIEPTSAYVRRGTFQRYRDRWFQEVTGAGEGKIFKIAANTLNNKIPSSNNDTALYTVRLSRIL